MIWGHPNKPYFATYLNQQYIFYKCRKSYQVGNKKKPHTFPNKGKKSKLIGRDQKKKKQNPRFFYSIKKLTTKIMKMERELNNWIPQGSIQRWWRLQRWDKIWWLWASACTIPRLLEPLPLPISLSLFHTKKKETLIFMLKA